LRGRREDGGVSRKMVVREFMRIMEGRQKRELFVEGLK